MTSSRLTAALLCVAALLLQGCASIVSGTTQVVSVDTPGCAAASCELANDKGKWYLGSTPGTITVSRAYGQMMVTCKQNEVVANGAFNSTTKGMAFGNILFGGIIGAGVDMSSGAAYDYPQVMSVPMTCGPKPDQLVANVQRGTDSRAKPKLGIKVENVSNAVAAATGLGTTEGVLVTDVDAGGLGRSMGVKVGQVLVEMNGKRIVNYDGLASDLANAPELSELEFLVLEGGQRFKVGGKKGAL
jgi:hypothetical protein